MRVEREKHVPARSPIFPGGDAGWRREGRGARRSYVYIKSKLSLTPVASGAMPRWSVPPPRSSSGRWLAVAAVLAALVCQLLVRSGLPVTPRISSFGPLIWRRSLFSSASKVTMVVKEEERKDGDPVRVRAHHRRRSWMAYGSRCCGRCRPSPPNPLTEWRSFFFLPAKSQMGGTAASSWSSWRGAMEGSPHQVVPSPVKTSQVSGWSCQGPDCFFHQFSGVLFVIVRDRLVFSFFVQGPDVKSLCTAPF